MPTITASMLVGADARMRRAPSLLPPADMSTTPSSAAAKWRVMMPDRSRIHSSEESMCSQISALVTTRDGR